MSAERFLSAVGQAAAMGIGIHGDGERPLPKIRLAGSPGRGRPGLHDSGDCQRH